MIHFISHQNDHFIYTESDKFLWGTDILYYYNKNIQLHFGLRETYYIAQTGIDNSIHFFLTSQVLELHGFTAMGPQMNTG